MKIIIKTSGLAYLGIFIFGFYANFAVLESLIDLTNNASTLKNLITNSYQFKHGLLAFSAMLILDIFLIWSLFQLTASTSKNLSYLASVFRGLHALFFTVALFKLFKVYVLTSNNTHSIPFQNSIMQLIHQFDTLWTVGLLFFSVHLVLLGILSIKTQLIPKSICFLLILAAVGYGFDGFSKLYFKRYSDYQSYFETLVILTGVLGEFSFTIWLLIKGFLQKKIAI